MIGERSKKEIKLNFRNIVQLVYGLVLTVYAVYINLNNKLAFASNFGNLSRLFHVHFFNAGYSKLSTIVVTL